MHALGVNDVFGIPGDFVLAFYGMLEHSPIRIVGTCSEVNAGYAADAYARINGLGAVCVTYCVGGLSLCNSIAGAYAEKSPVVVISGAPGIEERADNPLLHHRVRDFATQREVFEKHHGRGDVPRRPADRVSRDRPLPRRGDALQAPRLHRAAARPSRAPCRAHQRRGADRDAAEATPPRSKEALDEARRAARPRQPARDPRRRRDPPLRPAEAGDHARREAPDPDLRHAARKSVVSEMHPLYLGVYEGAMGREDMRRFVEESDCVILLGAFMTDINLGIYTAKLDPNNCIYATSEHAAHPPSSFPRRAAGGLRERPAEGEDRACRSARAAADGARRSRAKFVPKTRARSRSSGCSAHQRAARREHGRGRRRRRLAVRRGGPVIHRDTEFFSPAYYTSMGFAVPAALGVQVANRERRPLVLVGDGAFQMTGMELSTAVRRSSIRS